MPKDAKWRVRDARDYRQLIAIFISIDFTFLLIAFRYRSMRQLY